ncbi:hypothetical protein ABFA07_006158 [Porites harrisoni]
MTRLPFILLTLALLQVESAPKHWRDFLEKEEETWRDDGSQPNDVDSEGARILPVDSDQRLQRETCVDYKPLLCQALSPGTCANNPAFQMDCPRTCNMC